MSMSRTPKLLTTTEAGLKVGVSPSRIRQFIADGRLTAVKLGRDNFIDSAQLGRLVRRKYVKK
jgi:excisionase family DNA binding protein